MDYEISVMTVDFYLDIVVGDLCVNFCLYRSIKYYKRYHIL